ncbi:alanine racemase [Glaciecola sp. HTCC2999]|uniref:alanine racemase n=1 Tax=Glaciecola sp. HTCC2999 TaxID=455436 RepID=UPI0000E0E450|nr:alanine racemase [Glaciecola sp. HTCC2999]MCH1413624.1 alanine racemase [Glaciecola sp.]
MPRQTIAHIDINALLHNYHQAKNAAPQSQTMAVIKADGYGHGMLKIAQCLADVADGFAVAFIDEAIACRDAGLTQPILVLEGAHSPEDIVLAVDYDLWLVMHQPEQIDWLVEFDATLSVDETKPTVWFKCDTGLHRLGLSPNELETALRRVPSEYLDNAVLMGHFACADDLSNPMNAHQLTQLNDLANRYQLPISMANSPAIVADTDSHGQWNRLGIALYGAEPLNRSSAVQSNVVLKPVMTLTAAIIGLRQIQPGDAVGYGQTWQAQRPSMIATVAIGYGDGYPRHAPSGTPVFLQGQTVPLVGRVSMDMITVDVTDLSQVPNIGDMVELWGANLSVTTVAAHINTINYELVTRISPRVTKTYHQR